MEFYYQIRENGNPFGKYFDGQNAYLQNWTNDAGKKTYRNLTMCMTDAVTISRTKSVVVVKRMELPNGKWKELPIKVFKKK